MAIKTVKVVKSPYSKNHEDLVSGEGGLGGTNTGLDADDNVLNAAKKAGLY